ncbi:hypothetical protein GCM10027416_18380 [Okibacterium endophyticum]
MARLLLGISVVVVVATVYAVIDCAMIANDRVRGLSKPAWLVVILVIPVVGLLLWFFIGRGKAGRVVSQRLAPDDDPHFLGTVRPHDPEQDERIRQLEEELAALDDESDDTAEPAQTPDPPAPAPERDDTAEGSGTPGRPGIPGAAPDRGDHTSKRDDRGDAADA